VPAAVGGTLTYIDSFSAALLMLHIGAMTKKFDETNL